jgi:hypothetical protein
MLGAQTRATSPLSNSGSHTSPSATGDQLVRIDRAPLRNVGARCDLVQRAIDPHEQWPQIGRDPHPAVDGGIPSGLLSVSIVTTT